MRSNGCGGGAANGGRAAAASQWLIGGLAHLAGNLGEGKKPAGLTFTLTLLLRMRSAASLGAVEGSKGGIVCGAPSTSAVPEMSLQQRRLGMAGFASAMQGGGGAPDHPLPAWIGKRDWFEVCAHALSDGSASVQ